MDNLGFVGDCQQCSAVHMFITIEYRHRVFLSQCSPIFFLPVTPNRTSTLDRYFPITHEQQYFSQKCPFISIAHPIKREQITNYNH